MCGNNQPERWYDRRKTMFMMGHDGRGSGAPSRGPNVVDNRSPAARVSHDADRTLALMTNAFWRDWNVWPISALNQRRGQSAQSPPPIEVFYAEAQWEGFRSFPNKASGNLFCKNLIFCIKKVKPIQTVEISAQRTDRKHRISVFHT